MASMAVRKALWRIAFFTGAGGFAMFAYICAMLGPPRLASPERYWYFWPLSTLVLAVVSAVRLRRCHVEEPIRAQGLWQLRLADLLVVSFLVGLFYAVFQALRPDRFVQAGIPCGLLTGAALVLALLTASRNGLVEWRRKYTFAVGHLLTLFGAVSGGGLLVLCLIAVLMDGDLRKVGDVEGIWLFIGGLFGLPAGLWLCRLSRRNYDGK